MWIRARVIAIPKKGGGVRPIAIGEVLFRLLGRVLAAKLSPALGAKLAPIQWGWECPVEEKSSATQFRCVTTQ